MAKPDILAGLNMGEREEQTSDWDSISTDDSADREVVVGEPTQNALQIGRAHV